MNAPSKTEVEAPYVLREDKSGVATLTLNRGDRMNPLSTAMLSALQIEIDRLAKDRSATSDRAARANADRSKPLTASSCSVTPSKALRTAPAVRDL